MAAKKITCPDLCGVHTMPSGQTLEWGLVEYLADVVLQNALSSPELAELTIRVLEQSHGLRGDAQVGKAIYLTSEQHALLRNVIGGLQLPTLPPERLYAHALCNRAVMLAGDCADDEVPKLRLAMPKLKLVAPSAEAAQPS